MLVDKLPDAANLVMGALFLGQFLNGKAVLVDIGAVSIAAWIAVHDFRTRRGKRR